MVTTILKITKYAALEKVIKRLLRILDKKEKELKDLQDTCNHEIVVCMEEERCYGGYDDAIYRKCLLCGSESTYSRSFRDSKMVIDMSKYKPENCYSKKAKFQMVQDYFVQLLKEKPQMSDLEVAKLVRKHFEEEDKQFSEMMVKSGLRKK